MFVKKRERESKTDKNIYNKCFKQSRHMFTSAIIVIEIEYEVRKREIMCVSVFKKVELRRRGWKCR